MAGHCRLSKWSPAAAESPGLRHAHCQTCPIRKKAWRCGQQPGRLGWVLHVWDPLDGRSGESARSLWGPRPAPGTGRASPAWRPAGNKSLSGAAGRAARGSRPDAPAGSGAGAAAAAPPGGSEYGAAELPPRDLGLGRGAHGRSSILGRGGSAGALGTVLRQQPSNRTWAPPGGNLASAWPQAPASAPPPRSLPGTRLLEVPAPRSERGQVPRNHTRSGAEPVPTRRPGHLCFPPITGPQATPPLPPPPPHTASAPQLRPREGRKAEKLAAALRLPFRGAPALSFPPASAPAKSGQDSSAARTDTRLHTA